MTVLFNAESKKKDVRFAFHLFANQLYIHESTICCRVIGKVNGKAYELVIMTW
jgi:hypothetical protein